MSDKEVFTFDKFKEAIKARNIWLNNFKNENFRIKALLVDAFYPYQILMQKELKNLNPCSDYEIDSFLCIKEEPQLSSKVDSFFGTKTNSYVSISLYFLPKINDDILSKLNATLGFNEKQIIEPFIKKFEKEIKMSVKITYE